MNPTDPQEPHDEGLAAPAPAPPAEEPVVTEPVPVEPAAAEVALAEAVQDEPVPVEGQAAPMEPEPMASDAESEQSPPSDETVPVEPVAAEQAPLPAAPVSSKSSLPTTLTAAKDAAAFVASIFADAPQEAPSADAEAPVGEAVAVEAEQVIAPVPQGWPGESPAGLQGRHVLVLGLGASGLAMARWCARSGAQVTVADTREEPPQLATLKTELPQVRFVAGVFDAQLVQDQGFAAVYRSPGLSPEAVAPVLSAAAVQEISVGGELDLFAIALQALRVDHAYAPAVLAVTGTNGKTTVTALAGLLVKQSGKHVAVAGNIGPTLLDTLASHIDAGTLPQAWVIELSSFQLDGVQGFEPTAAAVLNVTQDHLDWHGSMDAYAAAKQRIFGAKGLMVLNREDPLVMKMLPEPVRLSGARPSGAANAPPGGSAAHEVASVGVKKSRGKYEQRAYVTFGADMPQRPGDYGIEVVNGMAWLVRAQEADETQKKRKGEEEEIHIQRLMPADALRIRGRHNAVNALSALILATAAGCPLGPMLYGLREYRGEPHRVEPVGIVNQVEYFDDSKGTNVGATVAALQGLGAERKVVVILGGDGKGQDFSPLAEPMARFARAAVLIGRDGPLIRAVLENANVSLLDAQSMEHAVSLATQRAHAGDAVLMSPACASFDMFRNYTHRAEVFRAAVLAAADEAGVQLEGAA